MAREILTAADLVAAQFGVASEVRERTGFTAGLTDAILVNNTPNRVQLVVVNLHTTAQVYLRPLQPASAANGIRLGPSGGFFRAVWREDLALPAHEWHVISDTAGAGLYILELLIRQALDAEGG